ncbi:TetR family transcriptional regulator [Pseudomonas psychrotolerans L19]|uniref:HTH-type transcriptional regulator RutR n=1 Tax=Pseudomonas TaxID=286 RepID=UPI00023A350F|nr:MULTISPECIES: HTH-type transcriptional regulator RutR [Pseudomonas]EHK68606.1 TetR family transcriptional regulator [Pseudomonas psychrotolerans L19]MBA1183093.1 HTH-type transcriptional regulator RutR [Pseudomonas psychrotolerans]MBA1214198.1 HTH-type transcriptional regulator RutR [Pseudomonas psychrotolerans]TCQ83047.1 TetR family transcriptional regulator [Pseudomonas sp. JUb52]
MSQASDLPPRKSRQPSPAAQQRRQRQIEAKRAQILSAALDIFSRFGLHGASLDQVALQADVSKTNLLYYFSNKEELYVAVLRQLLATWLNPLRTFSEDQEPLDALRGYLLQKLEMSRDYPAESRLFCLEMVQGAPLLLPELQGSLHDLMDEKTRVIRAWIAAGKLAPVDPHHLIFSIWAITQHYADFRVQVQTLCGRTLKDPLFFDEVLQGLETLIIDGLRPRAGGPA